MLFQRTIQKRIEISGIGIHTGQMVSMVLCSAPVNTGIWFIRTDLKGRPVIPVKVECVRSSTMATTMGIDEASVSTVEHLLSALMAFHVDNLFIEINGPEVPILDGSAHCFLVALLSAGIIEQGQPKKHIYINQRVYYGDGNKYAYAMPYNGLRVTCTIDFPHPQIGKQTLDLEINESTFAAELARARTFGFLSDLESLHRRGLAKGGNLENTVCLDDKGVMNPEGLRFPDEFVRHKMLDVLGDLAALGQPLMGHIVLYKSGHQVMNHLIRKILDSPANYRHLELGESLSDISPIIHQAL